MDVSVIGAGHVGLVSAACLATVGHRVRVQDIDATRMERLECGELPFFEPGLSYLVARSSVLGRLSFHSDPQEAIDGARLIFLCVPTPNDEAGSVDVSAILDATRAAIRHGDEGAVIVNRSTAPVGTAAQIRSMVEERRGDSMKVAVNPEFLSQGSALRDFLYPDRVVVGAWDPKATRSVLAAYLPILQRRLPSDLPPEALDGVGEHASPVPVIETDPPTAELSKYAANAFLAMRISFINEMAGIAEEWGGNVAEMARAVGLDRRIGPHFLRAGIGWGGSCFPKDIAALQGLAETRGLDARMLRAANEVNQDQRRWVIRKLQLHLKTLAGRRVGLLGLTFKPDTDDLRNAPALEIATELRQHGVRVRAFDPAIKSLPHYLDGLVELADDPVSLAHRAEALVVVTEWPEFADLDLAQIRRVMRGGLLLDGRNFVDPEKARATGFTYVGVGR